VIERVNRADAELAPLEIPEFVESTLCAFSLPEDEHGMALE